MVQPNQEAMISDNENVDRIEETARRYEERTGQPKWHYRRGLYAECEYWQSKIKELEKELCDTKADLGRAYNGIKHRDEQLKERDELLAEMAEWIKISIEFDYQPSGQHILTRYANLK